MRQSARMKGASPLIMVFLVAILAVGAFFLYKNYAVNLKSGASSVIQSANGTLLKKGSAAFITACGKTPTSFTYALTGGTQVLGLEVEAAAAPRRATPAPVVTRPPAKQTSPPRTVGPTPTAIPVPTYNPSVCLPLSITASLADPLVGQKVVVTGTYQRNIFYATTIKKLAACAEQCPGKDNVLRNCHPTEVDGSSADSLCNKAGRVELCGTKNFCCPAAGAKWTTDMTRCATPKPPVSPTPSPYVHVDSPNGGESYILNSRINITWSSGGLSSVLIYVVNNQGVSSLINGANAVLNGGPGMYSWVANPPNYPTNPTSDVNYYKIRIQDSTGKFSDSSDNFFKIYRPTPSPYQNTPVPVPTSVQ